MGSTAGTGSTRTGSTRRVAGRHAAEHGAVAVEFGLIAVILFTLLFGILQFGIWFWSWQTGAHAAREAARFAAVEPCDESGIAGKASAALDGAPVSGAAPDIDVDTPADVKVGDEITVHVHFTTVDLGFFPGFDGIVDKSATSRVENVPAGGC
ncbi:TadE family protein [Nocardioides dilutus]